METKTSINDVSAPGNSILETGTENSRLEGQLPSGENIVTSNEEPFECDLRRLAKPQSDEISLTAAPIIEVIDVKKSYFLGGVEVPILHDINLKVQEGEFLAIMGPSGSGKSTLMNLIGFLDRPTEGKIIIKGLDINKLSDKEVARLRGLEIGFIFQTFNLIPRLTALENVELPTYANSRSGVNTHERAKELLRLVGLEDRMHHKPGELSGGQSQRVAIARALINDPAILLADEPTGNLDSKTGCEILNIFKKLNEDGRTIVMITHDPEIAGYADRIVFLKDGIIQSNAE
ncbi:MAG: ABC transporter ATP-binding protein [Methanosarcina thermophila]|jgi:putative ABC transport system ATP-binding protein|uniref:ABC transporter ATP-binding protein n=3 Tax=Methanosarcina thermophila TaxID=2210 RepID=A0A1I6X6F5_METTE|nr:ABC transporter ATP-binding protein [Methanosarcina thermophila]ALK04633.1 MAG: ABC transporter ATP-binding protein [Methanosarcina sp. 795]AKB13310.1 ABC transporter, ATP-binding protein [Methanosarcina thermophila TM-1]AKB16055.1 ABC transporter, ATP-binding protein [Methanosarcina thermophila CHTI-55]NLU57422.1 ABC transporter ATP-binding protein [Methanosarcina thermophila]SFT33958.1 putative ABC transport system ATP-binding protein [Methanosarcina thermophila]